MKIDLVGDKVYSQQENKITFIDLVLQELNHGMLFAKTCKYYINST